MSAGLRPPRVDVRVDGSADPRADATAGPPVDARQRRVLVVLALLAVGAVAAFLLVGISGSWEYALKLRGQKVASMALVAVAIGASTVSFQTITNNRILTPSIMGFDALYVLIQSVAVYALGQVAVVAVPVPLRFAVEAGVLVVFAVLLHRWLFRRSDRDLYALVLAGIIFGSLFSSGSDLVNRMIDPNEFQFLQDRFFASFNRVDSALLWFAAVLVAVVSAAIWRTRRTLDVVALGRETAIALGVDHGRVVTRQLVAVTVLVAVATALVGPITFLGLLLANLARQLLGTATHRLVLPAAALLGIVALVGGQLILERVLGYATAISIVVNVVGGVYFLALLLREARR